MCIWISKMLSQTSAPKVTREAIFPWSQRRWAERWLKNKKQRIECKAYQSLFRVQLSQQCCCPGMRAGTGVIPVDENEYLCHFPQKGLDGGCSESLSCSMPNVNAPQLFIIVHRSTHPHSLQEKEHHPGLVSAAVSMSEDTWDGDTFISFCASVKPNTGLGTAALHNFHLHGLKTSILSCWGSAGLKNSCSASLFSHAMGHIQVQ